MSDPLLATSLGNFGNLPATDVAFENFNEAEEATCMASITLLRHSWFKAYILVPILSILTIFILPLKMYWSSTLYAKMIMNPVTNIMKATHVLVKGRGGN
jgi:hypothetical protein